MPKKKRTGLPLGNWVNKTAHREVSKTKSLAVDAEKHSRGTKHFTICSCCEYKMWLTHQSL